VTSQQEAATSTATPEVAVPPGKRWVILAGGVLVQLALGGVYAWSTFAKAMTSPEGFDWSQAEAAVPFETAFGMIFVGAFIGGRIQDARGPRTVAMAGGLIYSLGVIIASFAHSKDSLLLLVVGYGIVGGFGLGMAYIVPIAMLQKWFPDRPGLITGIVVGGFGFGAVITSPISKIHARLETAAGSGIQVWTSGRKPRTAPTAVHFGSTEVRHTIAEVAKIIATAPIWQ